MGSLNEVTLIGNLGSDAEIKEVNGTALAVFSVATSERFTDKSGEKQEKTEWHRCSMWGRPVDAIGEYLTKGTKLCVRGSLHTRKWDQDGTVHKSTEIKVYKVVLLGEKKSKPLVHEDDVPF